LFGLGDVGRRQRERDENRRNVGALAAIPRFVAVLAPPPLHRNGVAIAEILHVELSFDPGRVDMRRFEQGANRHAGRVSIWASAGGLGRKGRPRQEPSDVLDREPREENRLGLAGAHRARHR
jgi:hypothetical protein